MPDEYIQFSLLSGLDGRTDPHAQQLGSLDQAVNVVFDKTGAVRKRHGNVAQGTLVLPGNSYSNRNVAGVQVGAGALPVNPFGLLARGGEQLLLGGNRLYTYSPSQNVQLSKDQVNEAVGTRRPLHGSQSDPFLAQGSNTADGYYNADVCQTSDGFRVYAWTSALTSGNVFYSVHDATTPTLSQVFGNVQPVNSAFATTMNRVTLIAIGTAIVLLFVDVSSGKLYATTITHGSGGWVQGPCTQLSISGVADASPPNPFDVTSDDGVHFITASMAFGGGIQVARYLPDLAATGTYTASYTTTYGADTSVRQIALTINSGSLWVVWWYTGLTSGEYRVTILTPSTGAVLTAATTTGATMATDGFYLAAIPWATTQIGLVVANTQGTGFVVLDSTNLANPYESLQLGVPNLQPQSRPFQVGKKVYLLAWFNSSLQGTYAWIDINAENYTNGVFYAGNTGNAGPRVVATIAPRLASSLSSAGQNGVRQYGTMSNALTVASGVYVTPCGVVLGGSLPGSPNTQSLWETKLDFTHPNRGLATTLGRQLVLGQGVYDGSQVTEFGFFSYPEGYTGAGTTGGSLTTLGVYQYALIWEWLSDAGELVQSTTQAARNAQVLTVTLTGSQDAVSLTLSSLVVPPTTKYDQENGYSTPPVLAIYRTQAGGTTFTRVHGIRPTSGGTSYPASYVDVASDGTIASNTALYFEPGTPGTDLDKICPPSFSHTIAALGAIWGIGDDLRTVWYTTPYVEGFQPTFNEDLTTTIEDGGDLTALWTLNQYVIAFTATRIYLTYGQNPGATGTAAPPYAFSPIQTDVGCTDPRSLCTFPDGILFLSPKGFCVLGQDLTVNYLDAPEQILASYPNVTSAVLVPEHQEVRIELNNGTNGVTLVLNYWSPAAPYKYKWSTFQKWDAGPSVASCIASAAGYVSGYRWASSSGNPYTEDTTGATYLDAGTWVTMLVQTGWLAANGVVGYQRGKMWALIGDWYTSHDITVQTSTDFSPTTIGPFGQSQTLPSSACQGGPLDRLRIGIRYQKHQAVQFTIFDAYPTGADGSVGTGRGFSLAGLSLRVAAKSGYKLYSRSRTA